MMKNESWLDIQNKPVKELREYNLQLGASKKIRDDNGLTLFSITGKQQGGKSSYGMLILYEMYHGNVDEIMRHIVFTIEDFTKLISDAINGGYREKCIMWDDASITGSAAKWTVDPKGVMYLAGLGDTLGVATKSVIMTSPSGDMIKAFRNYTKYKIVINQGRHKYDRIARGYWIGKSPMEQRYCSLEFQDNYDTRIPFYERYAQVRKEISLLAIKNLNAVMKPDEGMQPITNAQRAQELYRDHQAGVFGDMSYKQVCLANRIPYSTAMNARNTFTTTTTSPPSYIGNPRTKTANLNDEQEYEGNDYDE
jgi:hypothetical protein